MTGFLCRHFKKASLGVAAPILALSGCAPTAEEPAQPVKTEHSLRTEAYNAKYSAISAFRQNLFLDRDEIHRRAAEADPALDYRAAMIASVKSYVLDRSGLEISDAVANDLRNTVAMHGGQAISRPFARKDPKTGKTDQGFACFIGGNNPDIPAIVSRQRVMGLYPDVHDKLINRTMRRALSAEAARRATDYHELGHCINGFAAIAGAEPGSKEFEEQTVLLRRQSETTAEIFTVLMLARDGINHVSGIMADQRLINLATNGYLGMRGRGWDDREIFSAYKYAMHEGIWAAQRQIDHIGLDNIRKMSPQDLGALARTIARQDPLQNMDSACAMVGLMKNKFDLSKEEKALATAGPSEQRAYREAFALRGQIAEALHRIYGHESFATDRSVFDQLPLEGSKLPKPQIRTWSASDLAKEFLRQAGGKSATPQSLSDVVMKSRDQWRQEMDAPKTAQEVDRLAARLALVPMAHREAFVRLKTGAGPVAEAPVLQNNAKQADEPRHRFCYN